MARHRRGAWVGVCRGIAAERQAGSAFVAAWRGLSYGHARWPNADPACVKFTLVKGCKSKKSPYTPASSWIVLKRLLPCYAKLSEDLGLGHSFDRRQNRIDTKDWGFGMQTEFHKDKLRTMNGDTMAIVGTIAVLGGTGDLGGALARRWAKAGLAVMIGSRSMASAAKAAAELAAELGCEIGSGSNAEVAAAAQIVVVTVPFAAQEGTLAAIREVVKGKLVVDTTVPLLPPKVMRVQLPPEGSAAVRAQHLLGDDVTVVSAFHNVSAEKLASDASLEGDVLVFGDSRGARARVVALAQHAGLRGIHGGALANSAAAEALTSVLIFVNKTYQVVGGAGIRLTGSLIAPE